jgi:hypothetical protein
METKLGDHPGKDGLPGGTPVLIVVGREELAMRGARLWPGGRESAWGRILFYVLGSSSNQPGLLQTRLAVETCARTYLCEIGPTAVPALKKPCVYGFKNQITPNAADAAGCNQIAVRWTNSGRWKPNPETRVRFHSPAQLVVTYTS